eukprot:TRINITY_DN4762_c0_g1_i10.p1 TRINITY_DN4762_c0_g1~~TRINITY_DN4762_c0_g1_i10.p1  ORF type:complete len:300 (-),score=57.41 TRINITY_DN4762_c0_g1_i10:166-1065(-)
MSMMIAQPDVKVDTDRVRVHAHLVLDISGSMESRWEHTVEGVLNVLKALSPMDFVYCTIFNNKVKRVCAMERVCEIGGRLLKALCKIKPSGSTALWDAILPSLDMAMKVYTLDMMSSASVDKLDYHMLVVLTDGEDTASTATRSDIQDVLTALHKQLPKFQSIFIGIDLGRSARSDLVNLVKGVGDPDCLYLDADSSALSEVFTKVVIKIQETVSFLASDGSSIVVGQMSTGVGASVTVDPFRNAGSGSSANRIATGANSGRTIGFGSSSSGSSTSRSNASSGSRTNTNSSSSKSRTKW